MSSWLTANPCLTGMADVSGEQCLEAAIVPKITERIGGVGNQRPPHQVDAVRPLFAQLCLHAGLAARIYHVLMNLLTALCSDKVVGVRSYDDWLDRTHDSALLANGRAHVLERLRPNLLEFTGAPQVPLFTLVAGLEGRQTSRLTIVCW